MMLEAYRYRFPFSRPFTTGGASYADRKGIIFILEADGIRAFGEASPLPGFSTETLPEVLQEFRQQRDQIHTYFERVAEGGHTEEPDLPRILSPALAFAIDTLRHDYSAKNMQIPLRELLFDDPMETIAVNATLSLDTTGSTLDSAKQHWNEGFRTFKIKIGSNFDREIGMIERLRNEFPESRIRIDANLGWTPNEARANLGRLESLNIEYCEEPIKNPDVDRLLELQDAVTVPIALDESLHRVDSPELLIKRRAGSVIVLKPMVFGSLKYLFETYRLAVDHGYTPVFTTSLECGIGRMMTANLAAGLGSPRFAHGLATGRLFNMDVWHDRAYIDSGHFVLPDDDGLGNKRRPDVQELALEPIG